MLDAAGLPAQEPPPATRGAAADLAAGAVDALAELGESVQDEWTYVTALADAGRARVRAAVGTDAGAPLTLVAGAAVAAACAEAARITDPHRAIDWLSTLPAVVELALGPAAGATPPAGRPDAATAGGEPPAPAHGPSTGPAGP